METVDVEKINEVEAEGDKPLGEPVVALDQGALLVERIDPPKTIANETDIRPASETPEAERLASETHPVNETPKVETRPASETSRKGKRKSNTEKVQCDKCLREFNPAYLSRHICKPVRSTSEPIAEEPTEPPPIPPPIVREAPVSEDPPEKELTAADVAAFLRKQKVAQRAEKMAKYSAAMFGA